MRITVGQLRRLLRAGVDEAKISAHPDYLKKERVREELQNFIAAAVATGKINDARQLVRFMDYVEEEFSSPEQALAMTALKMIPFEVWKKLGASRR